MNFIANAISKDRSKANVLALLDYIGTDASRVEELMSLVLGTDKGLAKHSSWVLYHLAEANDIDFNPYLNEMAEKLISNPHQAIERALLRVFWKIDDWPENQFTRMVDHMLNTIIDTNSTIAAQALSMEALLKHLKPYPELLQELVMIVEEGMPYGSAGYKAKARKIIKTVSRS